MDSLSLPPTTYHTVPDCSLFSSLSPILVALKHTNHALFPLNQYSLNLQTLSLSLLLSLTINTTCPLNSLFNLLLNPHHNQLSHSPIQFQWLRGPQNRTSTSSRCLRFTTRTPPTAGRTLLVLSGSLSRMSRGSTGFLKKMSGILSLAIILLMALEIVAVTKNKGKIITLNSHHNFELFEAM